MGDSHRPATPHRPAGKPAAALERLETFSDARVERYSQLLAIINDQPVPPSVVPNFDWLIVALRAALSDPGA